MTGSPGHDAQLQQQLQQRVQQQLSGELHHQFQSAPPPPPQSASSSSPWRTLSELADLPPDDMDDAAASLPHAAAAAAAAGVLATPFQQLVGSFGAGDVDDETVVSLDEPPFHRGRDPLDVQKPPTVHHQTRSSHLLYAPQRLNAPA